jgi:membrane protease YdiL (CAAX protease family)
MDNVKEFAPKKTIGIQIVYGLLLIILLLQTIPFLVSKLNFELISSQALSYLYYVYITLMYLSLSVLIYFEVEKLEEFHFDRFTVVTFVLGSIIRPRLGIRGEGVFLILIGLAGILVICTLILKKPSIPKTKLQWVIAGIVISSMAAILLTLLGFTLWSPGENINNIRVMNVLSLIVIEFSSAPIMEEVLLRGFLWGYLRRKGYSESKVFWVQGILFWLLHIGKIFSPFTFFVFIPIFTMLYSKLTLHSKQLFPAVIAHLLVNVVSVLFGWAVY